MKKLFSVILCIVILFISFSFAGCSKNSSLSIDNEDKMNFGMNIHNSAYESYPTKDIKKNIKSCKELGMDIVRYNQCSTEPDKISEIKQVAKLCHKNDMELMLVVDSNEHYTMALPLDEIEQKMEEYFYELSSKLGDAVDIYQIFNEMDVRCINGNSDSIFAPQSDGHNYDCIMYERSVVAVIGALKGIERGNPNAKTCVNFSWLHTALIYRLYEEGCRFDIVGIDWYSDCQEISSIQDLMNEVAQNIPDSDIMICETNYWMNILDRYPEEHKDALKNAEKRNELHAKWVPEFIDTLMGCNNPRLKGIIFYELLDEPNFEEDSEGYKGESHFGFIECDRKGQNQIKKPAFYALQEKIKEIKNN